MTENSLSNETKETNSDTPAEEIQPQSASEGKQWYDLLVDQVSELEKKIAALTLKSKNIHQTHQEAALSLGSLPGNAQPSLSPESLVAMSDEDFNLYWKKVMRS